MFCELTNEPRPYQWGDSHSIANWQVEPPGSTAAELWLGTHPGSEAQVVEMVPIPLSAWLRSHGAPEALPFLVKLLAAESPLSIQVHPTTAQAIAGYEMENGAGVSLEDPRRNYKDDSDKPEILVAWSERFLALAGFQSPDQCTETLTEMENLGVDGELTSVAHHAVKSGPAALAGWLFSNEESVDFLARRITSLWREGKSSGGPGSGSDLLTVWDLVVPHYPGDRGLVAASFLNLISLRRGEALYVPAGIPHAYLQGFGLEVMAPSDNVLRGGLTPKHIDRSELLAVLDPNPYVEARFSPDYVGSDQKIFAPPGASFALHHGEGSDISLTVDAHGPAIVVIQSGSFMPQDSPSAEALCAGKAYVGIVPDSGVTLHGSGSVFVVCAA